MLDVPHDRHCHISSASAAHETSTYVLRSIGAGTSRVHTRLNAGRAIAECDRPKASSSPAFTITAVVTGVEVGASMLFGTRRFPVKPQK
jgi:hypothetical protein